VLLHNENRCAAPFITRSISRIRSLNLSVATCLRPCAAGYRVSTSIVEHDPNLVMSDGTGSLTGPTNSAVYVRLIVANQPGAPCSWYLV
jgi:hypothetical protein